jgi:hypothetical protein
MNSGLASTTSFAWHGGGMREYRLVIQPDALVYERIMAQKQRFFLQYGTEEVAKTFPQIVVANFYAGAGMEATLIRWIQRICMQVNSFDIALNNYGGAPEHAIYIRIQDPSSLRFLSGQLSVLDNHVVMTGGVAYERHPYITFANDLSWETFQQAMPAYSRKTIHARFMATELVLQGRDHPFATCKTINVFRFLPASHRSYSEVA